MESERRSRFRGSLLGLAVGDALGTTLEFRPPGSFKPIQEMHGGGPFNLEPGQWTDDTSMALCLADSLVSCQGFNSFDQIQRYLRWYRDGLWSSNGRCFDIGNTVRDALERFEHTADPFSGSNDPRSAGNGSIMRLAPVAMFFARYPGDAVEYCAQSSRTTHAARLAVDACRYLGALLVGALNGIGKDRLLGGCYNPAPGIWQANPLAPEIEAVANGSFRLRQPPQIRGSGYVVESLEAALWAFHHSSDFRQGCLMAANLGDDADTTAAVFGQLAGAYYGEQGIPSEWLRVLALREKIQALADLLLELSDALI
jgi:ADP-ribosyl-[dinitrogen reductase] hydrolase